jgi:hypothetical protein
MQLEVPSALQMGGNESPTYFCATKEPVWDITQISKSWSTQWKPLPHQ